jgi:hypothetical protein
VVYEYPFEIVVTAINEIAQYLNSGWRGRKTGD